MYSRAVRPRSLAALSVLAPTAAYVVAAWVSVQMATGTDRLYAMRFTGWVALAQLLTSGLVAAALAAATRRDGRGPVPRLLPAIAASTATALPALFMVTNGFPPQLKVGAAGPLRMAAIALGAAAVVGLARLAATRGTPGAASTLLGPVLLAPALVATYEVERAHFVRPGSPLGLSFLLATLVVVALVAVLVARTKGTGKDTFARVVGGLLVAGALATLVPSIAVGRSPFPSLPPRAAGPPDVLLVVVDTVRLDAWPAGANAPLPTPTAARLAAEGRRFSEVFSTSCWTTPAHASLFTALDADEHLTGWESYALDSKVGTIAERFREAGYRTGGFSANSWITAELHFDRGFETFENAAIERKPRRPWPVRIFPGLFDALDVTLLYEDKGGMSVASEALGFLGEDPSKPAFVFVNLLESHLPYKPPRRWLERLAAPGWSVDDLEAVDLAPYRDLQPGGRRTAREVDGLRRLYAAEVAYDDDLLGRIVAALEASGRLDRTIVAVVADHGENVGEHLTLDHQLGLWDSLVRVPLVIRYPTAMEPGSVETRMASLSDVPGALLHLAGVASNLPPGPLIAPPGRDAVFFYYDRPEHILKQLRDVYHVDPAPYDRRLLGVRTADKKWIEASDGRNEAYDLAADSGETHNLFDGRGVPAGFEPLAEELNERRARLGSREAAPQQQLSDETLERLRSLGYVR